MVIALGGKLQSQAGVWGPRNGEDSLLMLVLGERVVADRSVAVADCDERDLARETHEAFVDERLAAQPLPGIARVPRGGAQSPVPCRRSQAAWSSGFQAPRDARSRG